MQVHSKTQKNRMGLVLLFSMFVSWYQVFGKSTVLFSPDDRPTKHLIKHISEAKNRIYAAVYMLTDKAIALSLIEAKKRGVDVQIVTDQTSITSPYGKIVLLQKNGIKTSIFKFSSNGSSYYNPLMHNKFAIIDNIVWTGSFNWTISANNKNQENVLYTDEKEVCEKYLSHFEKLKLRCEAKQPENQTKTTKRSRGRRSIQAEQIKRLTSQNAPKKSDPTKPLRR